MKLQAISAARIPVPNTKPVKTEQSKQIVAPYTVSFKGNPEHVIFYGAEFPDYDKKGGVANVMGYYDRMPGVESVIVQPYYRGRKDYNNYGKYTGVIEPHKFGQDCKYEGLRNAYFYSKFNFEKDNLKTETETNLDTNLQKKNILVLEEVSSAKALYGEQPEQTIRLFKVKKAVPQYSKENPKEIVDYKIEDLTVTTQDANGNPVTKNKNHFFVFTKGTAEFKVPYDDGSYSSDRKANPDAFSKFKPQPYAENNRAFVELKDAICQAVKTNDGREFKPATVVCSDSQTAYTIAFMRDEAVKKNPSYDPKEISASYVIHNLRRGYTGECGGLEMALNLGLTKDEIAILKQDPEFITAERNGTLGEYFAPYLKDVTDFSGSYNPTKIAFDLRGKGYSTGLNTVSKGYCDDLANNTNIPTALQGEWKELVDAQKAVGILNPFEDPGFHIFNGVAGMAGYTPEGVEKIKAALAKLGGDYATYADGIEAYTKVDKSKFPVSENGEYTVTDEALENLETVKNFNKRVFLNRLTEKFNGIKAIDRKLYNSIVVGLEGKDANLIGNIDEKLLAPDKIDNIKVYTSWGRLDSQKSLDVVMDAFDRFCEAHPEEKDNFVLVLGGEAPGTEYSNKILAQAEKLSNKYPGHVTFMEAFAPNKILASAAEQVLLPSREAPCELTDLETMRFLTMLTATRAQGMDDKNFDPDDKAEIATSFKTPNPYYLSQGDIEKFQESGIGEAWKAELEAFQNKVQTEMDNKKASAAIFERTEDEKKHPEVSLQQYIDNNPEHKEEFEKMLDKYRSLILTIGVVSCMDRGLKLTPEQKKVIFTNQLNMKTGWETNKALTGLGTSSAEAYKKIFRTKAEVDTSKYGSHYLDSLREHLRQVAEKLKGDAPGPTPPKPEPPVPPPPVPKPPVLKYVAYAAVAAAVVGGAVYAIAHRDSSNNNKPAFARK